MGIDFNMQDNSQDENSSDENQNQNQEDAEQQRQNMNIKRTLQGVTIMLAVLAVPHLVSGGLSVVLGVILCSRAPIWFAHTISPIWSGAIIAICGLVGLIAAKSKTVYTILCFTAASMVALIIGIVSLQLLRLGLVDHTTSGQTFVKNKKDRYVIVALVAMSIACGFAMISLAGSVFIAKYMKKMQRFLKRTTMTKAQMIADRQEQLRKQKEQEKKIIEKMEKEQARTTRYHRI
ncbi:uncharacterized protein [Amphiura filiformis]|uniref:uncharacterized protein n=1 Tax=Amphiura filiformis TaxID=82378 RepID=UPI003B218B2E